MSILAIALIAVTASVLLTSAYYMWTHRTKREEEDTTAFLKAVEEGLPVPVSLHPVIDSKKCIGSLACLSACPEGDILGIVDGKAALIEGSNCIGHGKCANECPVEAITLVFGTSQRGVDLPEVDENFESSRQGVHIVGELGGMGLIRNSVSQGVQVANYLHSSLTRRSGDTADVTIVGAGPAGIATALRLKELGLSFHLLEQLNFGGTVANYPRQKLVMVDTVHLPYFGRFGNKQMGKAEILGIFSKALGEARITVQEGYKVEAIEGRFGDFEVKCGNQSFRSQRVVLATGRRGTPRKLGAKGEQLEKVTYKLTDPEQYVFKRVMVVGGGDSALEAAALIVETVQADVVLSYRGSAFTRCRPANKEKIAALERQKKLRVLMSSEVLEIEPDSVIVRHEDKTYRIANDFVIVCAGGELPHEFLQKCDVAVKKYFGTALKKKHEITKSRAIASDLSIASKQKTHTYIYAAIGFALILSILFYGRDYYFLSPENRPLSPKHDWLKPGGPFGHGIGIFATLCLLSNFLYSGRKRLRWFKSWMPIRDWLTIHMAVGIFAPLVIIFHSAFQSNNVFATSTFIALIVLVITGIIGRYVYLLLPGIGDHQMGYPELLSKWQQHKQTMDQLLSLAHRSGVFSWATLPAANQRAKLSGIFIKWPIEYLKARYILFQLMRTLKPREYRELKSHTFEVLKLRRQIIAHASIRRIVSVWRILHVLMACFLTAFIAVHITISLYVGYRWIF